MAKYQYRVSGDFDWISQSGNGVIAITNPGNSGKKITIRSFEVQNNTYNSTASAGALAAARNNRLLLVKGTVTSTGTLVQPTAMDNASSLLTDINVYKECTLTSTTFIKRVNLYKNYIQTLANSYSFFRQNNIGNKLIYGNLANLSGPNIQNTRIILRTGENISLVTQDYNQSIPLKVDFSFLVNDGSVKRTYVCSYFLNLNPDLTVFTIVNNHASNTLELINFTISEVGTYDSPYLRLVPVGAVNQTTYSDPTKLVIPSKSDSTYPDPSSWVNIYKDVLMTPLGVPEVYLSQSSTGTPAGVSYLQTKDFDGPVYRTFFPEFVHNVLNTRTPDVLGFGFGQKNNDLVTHRSSITIREGEGLALVSSAETAVGLTSGVGVSGYGFYNVSIVFDIEPKTSPYLTLTGVQNNSSVVILTSGTQTQLASSTNVTGGTFSWNYDPDLVSNVDIFVHHVDYQWLNLTVSLDANGLTIPIQQISDRQYENPT